MNKSSLADIMLGQFNSWPGQNNYIFLPFIAVKTRLEGKVFIEIAGAGKNALRHLLSICGKTLDPNKTLMQLISP